MDIKTVATADFPKFWVWFKSQPKDVQHSQVKALILEQKDNEMQLAQFAEGHPSLPSNTMLCRMFMGRTLI